MPAMPHTTYVEAVRIIAQSVGHPVPVDVAGSVDEAVLRMGWYVNQACTELKDEHIWNELTKPHTMAIVANSPGQTEKAFDLPADFDRFVDDTHWNRATQMPAIGPVNPQDWQWLVVRDAMVTTRFMWRLRGGKLWIKSPPEVAQNFSFEYVSRNWAVDGDDATPKELMTKNGDYHLYPWHIVVLLGRAKWLKNEGYDSSRAESDYFRALEAEVGSNLGATALSLVPGTGFPYLNAMRNLPDTGYGS